MAIIRPDAQVKKVIDLSGPDGNAFALMGTAISFCRQLGRDSTPIIAEMQSGNYDNLIAVFDREFGSYVDLMLPQAQEDY